MRFAFSQGQRVLAVLSIACLAALGVFASVQQAAAAPMAGVFSPVVQQHGQMHQAIGLHQFGPFSTVITVTSTDDPNDSLSQTCVSEPTGTTAVEPCTLRRALVEVSRLDAADRPVQIRFAIPVTDTNHNDELGIWTITPISALPDIEGGDVTVDGTTQPGGRTDGPPIVLVGRGLSLGEIAGDDTNALRGFHMQGGSITVVANNNVVEENWLGLTDDGLGIFYPQGSPGLASNNAGISLGNNASNNIIRNNVMAGTKGVALAIRGSDNVVTGNYVGTRSDGTIPDIAPNRFCNAYAVFDNWLGGGNAQITGSNNRLGGPDPADANVFVGLVFPGLGSTPPEAVAVQGGTGHIVQNNLIGRDATGADVGTCGAGITVDGEQIELLDNTMVRIGGAAIGVFGSPTTLDAISWRGNTFAELPFKNGVAFGTNVPTPWRTFEPAVITSIDGTTVTGTSAPGSDCAECVIELVRDNTDDTVEVLESLVVVTAAADGSWTATLPAALQAGEALRTASTTSAFGQIANFAAGTSSDYSTALYDETGEVTPEPTPEEPFTPQPPVDYAFPAEQAVPSVPTPTYTTVITVTSGEDPSTSPSQSCYSDPGITNPVSPCTLRRAMVEADALPPESRPILIQFAIPLTDSTYVGADGVWVIEPQTALPAIQGGDITIDGTTQTGGRSDGPQIIIKDEGIALGEIGGDANYLLRGVHMQGGSISVNADDSFVVDTWLGFTNDGQDIYFPSGDPDGSSNNANILIGSGQSGVVVQNNRLVGTRNVAINSNGSDSFIVGNFVGLRADGTLPDPPDFDGRCNPRPNSGNWFGGTGINILGPRHQVTDNVLAGLLTASASATTTPPDTLEYTGDEHVIARNRIGLDEAGTDRWVCGRGLSGDGFLVQLSENEIVNTGLEAFGFYGNRFSINGITLRGNIARDVPDYEAYGSNVPTALTTFRPAIVTSVEGTTVSGTDNPASPCPFCVVELFLDDDDDQAESLRSLAVVTASIDGDWTATLTEALDLEAGERLRTTSTTSDFGLLPNFEAGTTSRISQLFPIVGVESVTLDGPLVGEIDTTYTYSATISPADAERPIDVAFEISDLSPANVELTGSQDTATVDVSWSAPGTKTVVVTASNGLEPVTDTLTIEITGESVPLTAVTLDGPTTGVPDEAYTFTATVEPSDATLPITYTWDATGLSEPEVVTQNTTSVTQVFTLGGPGTRTITVTADNGQGSIVTATQQIVIEAVSTEQPPTAVRLAGPAMGNPGTPYEFTATVDPADVTTPITFTWEADEQPAFTISLDSRNVTQSFTWELTGTKTVIVTVDNGLGVVSDTVTIDVTDDTISPQPPATVTVSGPLTGLTGIGYAFTALVEPADTTTPLNYTWEVTDQEAVTDVDATSNTQSFVWATAGIKQISLTVQNATGSASTTFEIDIAAAGGIPVVVVPTEETIFSPIEDVTITFPAGSFPDETTVTYASGVNEPLPAGDIGLTTFALSGDSQGSPVTEASTPFTVTLGFINQELTELGLTADDLRVLLWDGTQWVTQTATLEGDRLTFETTQLTQIALVGNPNFVGTERVFLPVIRSPETMGQ